MKNVKFHIAMDIASMWFANAVCVYVAVKWTSLMWVYFIPVCIWSVLRTYMWLRVAFDVLFSTPKHIYTKGYRFSTPEGIYALDIAKKIQYWYVYFDDERLKGRYIFFSAERFSNGQMVEVLYYPRSKYIKSIRRRDESDIEK